MVDCQYQPAGDGSNTLVCIRCRDRRQRPVRRNCPAARKIYELPCVYMGDRIAGSAIACRGCRGKTKRFKVYACSVHGQCVPAVYAEGVQCCLDCADYTPRTAPAEAPPG